MLKNLASALFLTHRAYYLDEYGDDFDTLAKDLPRRRLWVLDLYDNPPRTRGRIVTTIHKAKEVRPLVEKCITIAIKSLPHKEQSDQLGEKISRKENPDVWEEWANTRAPFVNARRRCLKLLGDRAAVDVLFDFVAPQILDQGRQGGYTRIVRLPTPRLGDAGVQAILEFVGFDQDRDRVTDAEAPVMPDFEDDLDEEIADDGEQGLAEDADGDIDGDSEGVSHEDHDATADDAADDGDSEDAEAADDEAAPADDVVAEAESDGDSDDASSDDGEAADDDAAKKDEDA